MLDLDPPAVDFCVMLMALGMSLFRVGWHARLVAILCETGLFLVLLLGAWLVDMSPAKYTLTAITAAEFATLFIGMRLHRRAADYDPVVAEFYREEREAEAAADHDGVQQAILDDLVAVGAAPATIDADMPHAVVREDAVKALSVDPAPNADGAEKPA